MSEAAGPERAVFGEADGEPLVWYAAYGSNLLGERLRCYLEGDCAPGKERPERGCRDPSPPRDERAIFLPHRLYFANSARSWQRGGVAFLDTTVDESVTTYGRSWLLTAEQFIDILRQENGDPELACDLPALLRDGEQVCGSGWYAGVLHLGDQDGWPVCTCTATRPLDEARLNAPSRQYLTVVIAGLRETFALNEQGVWKYLKEVPGIAGTVERVEVKRCYELAGELLGEG